ncbi:MAG TPA: twin-arginine translocase TatA/TatE family subunit [Candidatus Nitrosopolaris rasttigaisensis]|jgi:sec-independent protein translocase protein TatA|nr:twin-arginine translocase TatA/TatE family subunit [Candidatus Nitrosopolaris rasttigaisensis]
MTGFAVTDLQMAIVNAAEWIIIIAVIVAVIFGAKKVPELARSFGRATTEYEKAKIEAKKELQRVKDLGKTTLSTTTTTATNVQDREKLESVANTLGINYSEMSDDQLRSAIQTEINKDKNKV